MGAVVAYFGVSRWRYRAVSVSQKHLRSGSGIWDKVMQMFLRRCCV